MMKPGFRTKILFTLGSLLRLLLGQLSAVENPAHYFDPPTLDLVQAALRHHTADVQASRADPNTIGRERMTPLIYAVLKQNQEAIKLLLKAGADPVRLVPSVGSATSIAAKLIDTRALVTLLDNGADVHALVGGEPLSFSAHDVENRAALEIILAHGLSLDARNTRGETLLIDVLSVNDTDMAHWLVDRGADVHVMDRLFNSAANHLQMSVDNSSANNTKLPAFLALKAKFEQRGVRFPVPSVVDFRKRFGRNTIPVEEASKLDEQGKSRR